MTVTPRERILDAADHIFGSIGFDAATTREIAERSGVNKALIHYYFKSKDGLLADLLEGYYARLTETLSAILLRPTGSLRERVGDLVGGYLDFLHANRNFVRIVHREASGGHHMDLVADRTLPLFELGRALIRERYPATRAGELAAEQLLVSVYGMLIGSFTFSRVLERLLGTDPMSPDGLDLRKRHVCRLVDLIFDAIELEERP